MFTRRSTNSGVGKHESEGRAARSDIIHDYCIYALLLMWDGKNSGPLVPENFCGQLKEKKIR